MSTPARGANATRLDDRETGLVVLDEADDFADTRSAPVARIGRYAAQHPDVPVLTCAGTIRGSIMSYWHLLAGGN